ncbi:MAG: UPF0175 family protein [Saprospiraceae bacterium]|nr:MAG: UPF0175 family protein [Saprospiraceae bacterium]
MLIIEDEIVRSTQFTEEELRLEIAVALYEKSILSFGRARKLAGMGYFEFEKLLFDRNVPGLFTSEDLEADIATIEKLRKS